MIPMDSNKFVPKFSIQSRWYNVALYKLFQAELFLNVPKAVQSRDKVLTTRSKAFSILMLWLTLFH